MFEEFDPGTCGAWLAGAKERCHLKAGAYTRHPGEGRCAYHGGLDAEAADMQRVLDDHGLGSVINAAESLSRDDVEYIDHAASASLTVIRARIVAQLMESESRSTKEILDLSASLSRIDKALADITKRSSSGPAALTDKEAIARTEAEDAEMERLKDLAEKFGV